MTACQQLIEIAASGKADTKTRESAFKHALRLLEQPAHKSLRQEQAKLTAAAGTGWAKILILKDGLINGKIVDRTHTGDVLKARQAMRATGIKQSKELLDVAMHLMPRLFDVQRYREIVTIGKQTLEGSISKAQRTQIRAWMGMALLKHRKIDEALEYLTDYLAADPSDPKRVLEVVELLPPSYALASWKLLQPVVEKTPKNGQWRESYTECLDQTYTALDRLGKKKSPGKDIWNRQTQRETLPITWFTRIWSPGYRVYLHDNARKSKSTIANRAIEAVLPVSGDWKVMDTPPGDLKRWQNSAIVFQRGIKGPVLAIYWFGPTLQYWYGNTPVAKGLTSKAAAGNSKSGIAGMVARCAYGLDAKKRGQKFKKRSPLPFKLGVKGTRRAWQLKDMIYDETFFQIGQVTIEVVLRIDEKDLERHKPEIEWMYRNIRALSIKR